MLGKHGITKSGAIPINMRAAQKSLDQHRGINPEILKQISIFDPEELKAWDSENDATENS
jgi:hypothetical protein